MCISVSLSEPQSLPLRGRWQPEGLTEEAIEQFVFAEAQTKTLCLPHCLFSQKSKIFDSFPEGEAFAHMLLRSPWKGMDEAYRTDKDVKSNFLS